MRPAARVPAPTRGLADAVLGRDPAMRAAMQRTLMAASVCLLWTLLEVDAWRRGIVPGAALLALLVFNGAGSALFIAALRSGWSRRRADLGMTQAQMTFAALSMSAAYAAMPHTRVPAVQVMCLALLFGMFRLTPRQMLRMGWISSAALMAAAAALAAARGPAFSPRADLLPAVLACVVMLMMSIVLRRFCRLRERLDEQRRALGDALRRVEELATRDALTGLYNRRQMELLIEQECARHTRSGAPLTVALLDLDHFKRVNDTHGHPVGDEVLVGVARTLARELRDTDLVGRWGGEEFLVLLPGTAVDAAAPVFERARAALRQGPVAAAAPALRVAFCAGLAEHEPGAPPPRALERADRALYAAKAAGRDCCRVE